MKLKYENKEIKLMNCKSFYSRFKGFMGKKNINNALLFERCNSIHTFFMKENIDIIMLDNDNNILYYFPDIEKNKIIIRNKAKKVIEIPPKYFNIKLNTKIEIIN